MKKQIRIALALCILLIVSGCSNNAHIAELEGQIAKSNDQVAALQANLDETHTHVTELISQNKTLETQLHEREAEISALQAELTEYREGAAFRLVEIKNHYEKEDWKAVIDLAKLLHEKHNGSPQDVEAQQLAKDSEAAIAAIEEAKRLEAERIAAEQQKSAQEKARSIIRVSKLKTSSPNSAGGIDLFIGFTNNSDNVIKYITFSVRPYNAVGDSISCDITRKSLCHAHSTGPYKKGEGLAGSYKGYWENAWYNWSLDHVELEKIEIEYMDGKKTTLTGDDIAHVMY